MNWALSNPQRDVSMGRQTLPRQEKQDNRSHGQNQKLAQFEDGVRKLLHKGLFSTLMK